MSRKFGIDVSHYQLEIDWKAVKEQGIEFAILKCQYEAQNHRIDEYFEQNYAGCQQNGISTGVYIFIGTKSIEDPEHDANCLLGHLKGRTLEYGIWIDLEATAVRALGKKKITELVRVYERIFKNAGYFVGIYANLDWYRNVLDVNALSDLDMWIARYPKNDDGTLRESLNPGVGVAWQYSSKGRLRGIRKEVDLDVDFDGIINLTEGHIPVNPYHEPASSHGIGAMGNVVRWIQFELNCAGYDLKVDGDFGEKTKAAVIDFQTKQFVDGIVGPLTIERLKKVNKRN